MDVDDQNKDNENEDVCIFCGGSSELFLSVQPVPGSYKFMCMYCWKSSRFINGWYFDQTERNFEHAPEEKNDEKNSNNGDSESNRDNFTINTIKIEEEDSFIDLHYDPLILNQGNVVDDNDDNLVESSIEFEESKVNLSAVDILAPTSLLLNSPKVMAIDQKQDQYDKVLIKNSLKRKIYNSNEKLTKVSRLRTPEIKEFIEAKYSVDRSQFNESDVNNEILKLDISKFQCRICGVIKVHLRNCQEHVRRHLGFKPYFCKICVFSSVSLSDMRRHIWRKHSESKPKCDLCNVTLHSYEKREDSIGNPQAVSPSEEELICKVCGKIFNIESAMFTRQMMSDEKDGAYKCDICSQFKISQESLEQHRQIYHSVYVCKNCDKIFKNKSAFYAHKILHSEKKLSCPYCTQTFKKHGYLEKHILKHVGALGVKLEEKPCGE